MNQSKDAAKGSRIEGALCYLGLWVTGLILYFLKEKDEFVRFHAKQSIATFLPLTLLPQMFGVVFPQPISTPLNEIIYILTAILWIVCMIEAYHGELWKVPLIGDLVETPSPLTKDLGGLISKNTRVAGLFCYAGLFVTGLFFYAFERENEFVRFHAKQSIATFFPLTIVIWLLTYVPEVGQVLSVIVGIMTVMLWVVCMVKAYQGYRWRVPVVGRVVDKLSEMYGREGRPEERYEEGSYPYAVFQFVTKISEVAGSSSLTIFTSAIDGYNERFGRKIRTKDTIALSDVNDDEWPDLIAFILHVYDQCVGPVTWEVAKQIEGLREIAEKAQSSGVGRAE